MKELAQFAHDILGLRLSSAQLSAFQTYEDQLIEWNQRFNLTAISEPEKIRIKHFLDSLTCLIATRDTAMNRIADVGAGAGFPGIPLKIVFPSIRLSLIESVTKKANFCRHIVMKLGLEGVDILNERVEVVASMEAYRQKHDWAIARAVAPMPVLMEYMLPLVKVGGKVLAMKGETGPIEVQESDYAIRLMGGRLQQIIPVSLPTIEEERCLVVVEKVVATPDQFPRKVGQPLKRPFTGNP